MDLPGPSQFMGREPAPNLRRKLILYERGRGLGEQLGGQVNHQIGNRIHRPDTENPLGLGDQLIPAQIDPGISGLEFVKPVPVGGGGYAIQHPGFGQQKAARSDAAYPGAGINAALDNTQLPVVVMQHPARMSPYGRHQQNVGHHGSVILLRADGQAIGQFDHAALSRDHCQFHGAARALGTGIRRCPQDFQGQGDRGRQHAPVGQGQQPDRLSRCHVLVTSTPPLMAKLVYKMAIKVKIKGFQSLN